MQNVLISIEESAVDKVMYLLKNLSDVKILSSPQKIKTGSNSLDEEIHKRVEHYKSDTLNVIEFDAGLDKIREKVVPGL